MTPARDAAAAGHTVPLAGGAWGLWRWACFRTAGFPVDTALQLAVAGAPTLAGDEDFAAAYGRARQAVSARVRDLAASSRFRLAVTWQNRAVVGTALDGVVGAAGSAPNSKARRREQAVAGYAQRYATRNDTIGFFGPIGWATLDPGVERSEAGTGPTPVAECGAHFEAWAIQALADAILDEPALRDAAPLRLPPYARVDPAGRLHLPLSAPIPLPPLDAAVLARCDGTRPAHRIAADVAAVVPGAGEHDVLAAIERLEGARRLQRRFDVGKGPHPDRVLRELLGGLDAPAEPVRHALDRMQQALAGAAATASPDEAGRALEAVESAVAAAAGASPFRLPGRAYAGRSPYYLDCTRSGAPSVGSDVLEALAPLALLLASARWLTNRLAAGFRRELRAAYGELAPHPGAPVEMASLWARSTELLFNPAAPLLGPVVADFQERWARVLGLRGDGRATTLATVDLAAAVETEFAAPHAGWGGARFNSPDFMVAAGSELQLVLGELHLASNTLDAQALVTRFPNPPLLAAARRADLGQPAIVILPARDAVPSRVRPGILGPDDVQVAVAFDSPDVDGTVRRLSDFVVQDDGVALRARGRDGSLDVDLLDFLDDALAMTVANSFQMLAPRKHVPRVTIDRLVVQRETWTFEPDELGFAWSDGEATRFRGCLHWAAAHSLPRHLFYRGDRGVKPVFLDVHSPLSVELFSRAARQHAAAGGSAAMAVAEMLPAPDDLWLAGAGGERYTSELRVVAVDPLPVTPPR